MICAASLAPPPVAPLPLGTTDVPEMLELTAVTEPAPFLPQTIQMGSYFGIRASDGRLVAMAGAITIHYVYRNQRGVYSSRISGPRICGGPHGVSRSSDSGDGKDSFSSRQV
jgi:hypothetical protein